MNGWYPEQQYIPTNQNPYINCGERDSSLPTCTSADKYCLFHIASDPCEYNNIASLMPDLSLRLYIQLLEYAANAHPPLNKPVDPKANPKYYNKHWTDWMDPNPIV